MSTNQQVKDFLSSQQFAVVGASTDQNKFGNKVFRLYLKHGYDVRPVNPNSSKIEGQKAFASLSDLPDVPMSISIITPPPVTEKIVADAISLGVQHIWMQPGAESQKAIELCEGADVNLIHSGPCILIVLDSLVG